MREYSQMYKTELKIKSFSDDEAIRRIGKVMLRNDRRSKVNK